MPYQPYEQNFGQFESQERSSNMGNFLSENCLVALLCTSTMVRAEKGGLDVDADKFDKQFGKDVGDALRKIGCDNVKVDGDNISLHLKDTYYQDVNQGGLNRVRLSKDVSLKVSRDGNSINVTDINGVDLDFGRFTPWVGLPDIKLSRGSAEINLPIKNLTLDVPNESYDQLNDLLKKLGK